MPFDNDDTINNPTTLQPYFEMHTNIVTKEKALWEILYSNGPLAFPIIYISG